MPTVVVTGAAGALGAATVRELERRGARVIGLTRKEIDLSSMSSVRTAARELGRSIKHVDALLNVAAVFTTRYQKTKDGFELMFATNHLGPFLLTNLLRERLADGGRVITVTAPSTVRVDLERVLDRDRFRSMYSFGASKAANLLFTFELARRAHRWDVRANAFYPGLLRSELMREAPGAVRRLTRLISRSPARAAQDLADLALSPAHAGTTGWFFRGPRRIDPPKAVQDPVLQSAVWKRSAELIDLEGGF